MEHLFFVVWDLGHGVPWGRLLKGASCKVSEQEVAVVLHAISSWPSQASDTDILAYNTCFRLYVDLSSNFCVAVSRGAR